LEYRIVNGRYKQGGDSKGASGGGWSGTRAFKVALKTRESAKIASFYLSPADGSDLPGFDPGQYIELKLMIEGQEVRRKYSLSDAPTGMEYRISVERQLGGTASTYLHDCVAEGDIVEAFAPSGSFRLRENDGPLVLISSDVGIMPMMAMLRVALQTSRAVYFIHEAKYGGTDTFLDFVDYLASSHQKVKRFYIHGKPQLERVTDDTSCGINEDCLRKWLPPCEDADVYLAGSESFIRRLKQTLSVLHVPKDRCRYEIFDLSAQHRP
jgi:nitric oxide dioxygenase